MKQSNFIRTLIFILIFSGFLYHNIKAVTHDFQRVSGFFIADSIRELASSEVLESMLMNKAGNLKAYRVVIDTVWVGLDADEPVEFHKIIVVKNDTLLIKELHPSQTGNESYNPVKWLNEDDLLFTDVGAYDVAGFLLYRVKEDSLYNIDYSTGYELLITEVNPDKEIKIIYDGNIIIDFTIE